MSKNSIIQGAHNRENPYAQISRALAQDEKLSLEEKGLLLYFLSLPKDWTIHPIEVAKKVGVGQTKIYHLLKSLIEQGYCTREDVMKGNLRDSCIYTIYEHPISKKECRNGDSNDCELSGRENRDAYIIDKDIEKKERKKETPPPPEPPPPLTIPPTAGGGGSLVFKNGQGKERILTDSDIFRYMLKYPAFTTDIIIEAMAEARVATGVVNDPFGYLVAICARLLQKPSKPLTIKEKVSYAPPLDTSPKSTYMEAKARMEAKEKAQKEKKNGV